MFSVNAQKLNQYRLGDRKGKTILVGDGCPHRNLEYLCGQSQLGFVGNGMLALQEIQAPPTPAPIRSHSVVLEKEKKKTEQPPRQRPSILLFTSHIKPRLRWTPELHARFTDAINELGGAARATPKAVQTVMDLEGLTLYHVKSHLQKYRQGKVTVRKPKEKIRSRSGTSGRNLPSPSNGFSHYNIKKTSEGKKEEQGELYLKLQEAHQKYIDNALQDAYKHLVNEYISGANSGSASMFRKNLAGVGTASKTAQPSGFGSCQPQIVSHSATGSYMKSNGYSLPTNNSTDAINDQPNLKEQPRSSLPQNVAYSADRGRIASHGHSYPVNNSTNSIDAPSGLKEQPQSFLPQNVAYSANGGLKASHGHLYPVNNSSNAIDVAVGLKEQLRSFLPQNIAYPANQGPMTSHGHSYPVNNSTNAINVAAGLQDLPQTFQPQNVAYSANAGLKTSNGNSYVVNNSTNSIDVLVGLKGKLQPVNNSFPTSNGNYSGTAAYSATYDFPNSNRTYSGSGAHFLIEEFPASYGNHSGSAVYSSTKDFPTTIGKYSASASHLPTIGFPTLNGNYSGSAAYSAINNLPTSNGNFCGSAAYFAINNLSTSNGRYCGSAALPATNDLPTSNMNYPGSAAFPASNNLPTSKAKYSETGYLEDLTAALAATGNNKGLRAVDEDPLDAFVTGDNPEPNSFTNMYGVGGSPM